MEKGRERETGREEGKGEIFVTSSKWFVADREYRSFDPFDERSSRAFKRPALSLSLSLFFFSWPCQRPFDDRYSVHVPVQTEIQSDRASNRLASSPSLPLSFLSLTQIIISIGALLFLIVGWSCRVWHWTCTVLIKYHRYSSTVGNSIGARIASFFFFLFLRKVVNDHWKISIVFSVNDDVQILLTVLRSDSSESRVILVKCRITRRGSLTFLRNRSFPLLTLNFRPR